MAGQWADANQVADPLALEEPADGAQREPLLQPLEQFYRHRRLPRIRHLPSDIELHTGEFAPFDQLGPPITPAGSGALTTDDGAALRSNAGATEPGLVPWLQEPAVEP